MARLQIVDPAQGGFPVLLELCSDEPIVGIAGGIAALRQVRLIARLLELQVEDALLLVLSIAMHTLGLQCRLDRHGLDRPEQLLGDCGVYSRPPKGHASRQAHHKVWLVAAIHRTALGIPGVGNAEPASASAADQDARQQRAAASSGLRAAGAAIGVGGELLLVSLVFRPADIAFMMILDHHLPGADRLTVAV